MTPTTSGVSLLFVAAALIVSPAPALAQGFGGTQRIGAFTNCVGFAFPPGDHARVFEVELPGLIRCIRNGFVLTAPFLDLSAFGGGGNGLTGLAFDPDYSTNGFFYTVQTTRAVIGVPSGVTLARYHVSDADPNIADAASRTIMLIYPSGGQHTGGWIGFGPDRMLYLSTGDTVDSATSQRTTTLAGKMLRLDPHTDSFPGDPLRFYSVPPDNPFAASATTLPEIWALGLRNPFRCSFDRATGDLWIADVGNFAREEINRQPSGVGPASAGLNYGWACREGFIVGVGGAGCPLNGAGFTQPILDLTRSQASDIIGGYVYRGCANRTMQGRYIFGDQSSTRLYSLSPADPLHSLINHNFQMTIPTSPYGFGEDIDGELYICGQGGLFKLLPPADSFTDCNHNGRPDACEIADGSSVDANNDGLPDGCTRLCPADVDASGQLGVGDIFAFLPPWFALDPAADFNAAAGVTIQDLFDFLAAYFAGCP